MPPPTYKTFTSMTTKGFQIRWDGTTICNQCGQKGISSGLLSQKGAREYAEANVNHLPTCGN